MRIRRLLLVASLLGFAFASACTTTSKGDPPPTGTTTSDATPRTSGSGEPEDLPFAGAPEVNSPLDTSQYEKDPCQSLTADQAQYLNLPTTGKPADDAVLSAACEWENPTTRGYVQIAFIVDDPRGLSPEYDANKRHRWAYFEVLPNVEGYPAVARSRTDDRDIGHCTVVVGVADDMAFESIVRLSQANVEKKDPCKVASQVAGLAVQTMKKGA